MNWMGWIIVGPFLAIFVLAIILKIEDFFYKQRLKAREKQERREMVLRITEGMTKEEINEMAAGMQKVIDTFDKIKGDRQ